jgi:hypothetical protein
MPRLTFNIPTAPTHREDGSLIGEAIHYRLYENNVPVLNDIGELIFSLDIPAETNELMSYQVSTVVTRTNNEGALSEAVTVNFSKPLAPTGLTVSVTG